MKFTLGFKTPDVTDELDAEELDAGKALLDKYLEYGEYIYVEFDTEAGKVTVLPK